MINDKLLQESLNCFSTEQLGEISSKIEFGKPTSFLDKLSLTVNSIDGTICEATTPKEQAAMDSVLALIYLVGSRVNGPNKVDNELNRVAYLKDMDMVTSHYLGSNHAPEPDSYFPILEQKGKVVSGDDFVHIRSVIDGALLENGKKQVEPLRFETFDQPLPGLLKKQANIIYQMTQQPKVESKRI